MACYPFSIMTTRLAVEATVARIRPAVRADGGDIELVDLDGDVARVRMTGECARCPSAEMTLHLGLENALRRIRPTLRVVRIA